MTGIMRPATSTADNNLLQIRYLQDFEKQGCADGTYTYHAVGAS